MSKLCKQLGLKIEQPEKYTRKDAMLDFMICGKNIIVEGNRCVTAPSDHLAIRWEISIDFPTKDKQLKIPSKKTAERITRQLLKNNEVENTAIFLEELYLYRKDNHGRLQGIVRPKPRELALFGKLLEVDDVTNPILVINQHYHEFWQQV